MYLLTFSMSEQVARTQQYEYLLYEYAFRVLIANSSCPTFSKSLSHPNSSSPIPYKPSQNIKKQRIKGKSIKEPFAKRKF